MIPRKLDGSGFLRSSSSRRASGSTNSCARNNIKQLESRKKKRQTIYNTNPAFCDQHDIQDDHPTFTVHTTFLCPTGNTLLQEDRSSTEITGKINPDKYSGHLSVDHQLTETNKQTNTDKQKHEESKFAEGERK